MDTNSQVVDTADRKARTLYHLDEIQLPQYPMTWDEQPTDDEIEHGFRRIRLYHRRHPTAHFALVDAQMVERVNMHRWSIKLERVGSPHVRMTRRVEGRAVTIYLHRWLMNARSRDVLIDHINHDGLDNRFCNLRNANHVQNNRNAKKTRRGKSMFRGVTLSQGKWQASISVSRTRIYLGVFDDEIDAARAYDRAARRHHKEFAQTNFESDFKPTATEIGGQAMRAGYAMEQNPYNPDRLQWLQWRNGWGQALKGQ